MDNGDLDVGNDLTVDSSVLNVDSINNRVGIGTNSPVAELDVRGNVNFTGWVNASKFCLGGACIDSWSDVNGSVAESFQGTLTGAGSSGKIALWNSTESINDSVISQFNGNIGIGSTTPSQLLTVNGSVTIENYQASDVYLRFRRAFGGPTYAFFNNGPNFELFTQSGYNRTFMLKNNNTDNKLNLRLKQGDLFVNGSVLFGDSDNATPSHRLEIIGGMNATQINATETFCIGGKCVDSWDDVNLTDSYDASDLWTAMEFINSSLFHENESVLRNNTDINGSLYCLGSRCIDSWSDVNLSGGYDDSGVWTAMETVNLSLEDTNNTINNNNASLAAEISTRESEDTAIRGEVVSNATLLKGYIDNNATFRDSVDDTLRAAINSVNLSLRHENVTLLRNNTDLNVSLVNATGFCVGETCIDSWSDVNLSGSSYDDSGVWAALENVNASLFYENTTVLRNNTDINGSLYCLGSRCIDDWSDVNVSESFQGTLTGAGSFGYIALWNGTESMNDSVITQLSGMIGIGYSDPMHELTVNGTVMFMNGTLVINNSNEFGSAIYLSANPNFGGLTYQIATGASSSALGTGKFGIRDKTSDTYRFVIDSSGNVGVGTKSPDNRLDINGSVNASGQVNSTEFCIGGTCINDWDDVNGSVAETFKGTLTGAGNNGKVAIWNGTDSLNDSVIFQENSMIGIGDVVPTEKLTVNGSVLFMNGTLVVNNSNEYGSSIFISANPSYSGLTYQMVSSASSGSLGAGKFAIRDRTSNVYRFVIDSSGNVGIGTDDPKAILNIKGTDALLNVSNSSHTFLYVNSTEGGKVTIGATITGINSGTLAIGRRAADKEVLVPLKYSGKADALILEQYVAGGDPYHRYADIVSSSYAEADNDAPSHMRFFTNPGGEGSVPEMRMIINSNGSVGIGTSHPRAEYLLDVNGSININDTLYVTRNGSVGIGYATPGDPLMVMKSVAGGVTYIKVKNPDSTGAASLTAVDSQNNYASIQKQGLNTGTTPGDAIFFNSDDNAIRIITNYSGDRFDGLTIFSNGSVGIGTSAPEWPYMLDVNGSMKVNDTFYVTHNGSVGIGTESPNGLLEINGSTTNVMIRVTNANASGNNTKSEICFSSGLESTSCIAKRGTGGTFPDGSDGNNTLLLYNDNDGDLVFGTAVDGTYTQQMRINGTSGQMALGNGTNQVNVTLTSPDGNEWDCGVDNSGTFSCSPIT